MSWIEDAATKDSQIDEFEDLERLKKRGGGQGITVFNDECHFQN